MTTVLPSMPRAPANTTRPARAPPRAGEAPCWPRFGDVRRAGEVGRAQARVGGVGGGGGRDLVAHLPRAAERVGAEAVDGALGAAHVRQAVAGHHLAERR